MVTEETAWCLKLNIFRRDFESWAKESCETTVKIVYRNDGRTGRPKGGAIDCAMIAAIPVLPVGYVVSASRIADRRMTLAGYRLADLLIELSRKSRRRSFNLSVSG